MATGNFVTNILQTVLLCLTDENLIQVWNMRASKWQKCKFLVNYPFHF